MAQRTRRNLSDPRIKKIVKSQTASHTSRQRGNNSGKPNAIALLKLLALVAIIVSGIAIIIYPNQDRVSEWWESFFSPQTALQSANPSQLIDDAAALNVPGNSNTALQLSEQPNATRQNIVAEQQTPSHPVLDRGIQVEVLNGCGVKGLAERLTGFLRGQNIDVVSRGNYIIGSEVNFDVVSTMLLDRSNNHERAQKVAELMGIPKDRILLREDIPLQLDITIVLGADYSSLIPFQQ